MPSSKSLNCLKNLYVFGVLRKDIQSLNFVDNNLDIVKFLVRLEGSRELIRVLNEVFCESKLNII